MPTLPTLGIVALVNRSLRGADSLGPLWAEARTIGTLTEEPMQRPRQTRQAQPDTDTPAEKTRHRRIRRMMMAAHAGIRPSGEPCPLGRTFNAFWSRFVLRASLGETPGSRRRARPTTSIRGDGARYPPSGRLSPALGSVASRYRRRPATPRRRRDEETVPRPHGGFSGSARPWLPASPPPRRPSPPTSSSSGATTSANSTSARTTRA